MGEPILSMTDGTNRVDFVSEGSGFCLVSWRPAKAAIKGGGMWRDSPLSEGRKLRDYRWANAVETWNFAHQGLAQDQIIARARLADQLLVKAVEYWATPWTEEPVWMEARGPEETNVRYAEVRGFRDPEDANPYAQPFFSNFVTRARTALSVVLERGQWQSRPPCGRDNLSEGAFEPQESADDAVIDSGAGGSINLTSATITFGEDATGDDVSMGIRFRGVVIPHGARILSAFIRGVCNGGGATVADCCVRIRGERNAAPVVFSTYANFNERERTMASVAWPQIAAWAVDTDYDTPDLTGVVQEIVGLPSWSAGSDLVVFVEELNSTTNAWRRWATWNSTEHDPPVLHVVWVADPDECFDCVPVGARQAYDWENPEDPFVPEQSADDAAIQQSVPQSVTIGSTTGPIGADGSSNLWGTGIRFRDVTVGQGATIISAWVRLVSATNQAGTTCNARVVGEDNAFPAQLSTVADWFARSWTAAWVAWLNIPTWIAGTTYDTPDITTVVQEIVDLPGWRSSNNMVIYMHDDGADVGAIREGASWDHAEYPRPELWIIWLDEDGLHRGQFGGCSGSFVASKHNEANITHIFRANNATSGAVFSDNLVGHWLCGACGGLLMSPVVNDLCAYFIIDTSLADSGPFDNLVLNIGDPAAYEGLGANEGIIWEYRDAAGWSWAEITSMHDGTNDHGDMTAVYEGPFTTPGRNILCWEPASDWTEAAVNGITGWAIRARVIMTSGSISRPYQCDQEIYTVVWPYVEIGHPRRGVLLPAIGADDCRVNESAATIDITGTELYMGNLDPFNLYSAAIRFRKLGIPAGATILSAHVRFVCSTTNAVTTVNLEILAELNSSPAQFTTHADWVARQRTSALVPWDAVPAWTAGTEYVTPDFAAVVQEVVHVAGWDRESDLVVFVDTIGSSVNAYRRAASLEHATYDPPWLCVTWTESPPGGDVPLRIRTLVENESYRPVSPNNELEFDEVMVGLRSLSRGENFRAYLNTRYQNPDGLVGTKAGGATWTANPETADGWSVTQTVAASANLVWWVFDDTATDHFFGTFRVFVRGYQSSGSAGDLDVQLTVSVGVAGLLSQVWASDLRAFHDTNDWNLLDMGLVAFPPFDTAPTDINELSIGVWVYENTVGSTDVAIYDLVLIPVDEWSGHFLDHQWDVIHGRMADLDGLTRPKRTRPTEAFNRTMLTTGKASTPWPTYKLSSMESRATVPMLLQANAVQRLHFLFGLDGKYSHPAMAARVRIDGVQRYRSMRGAR